MNGNNANPEQERAKYVRAFNFTMIKIWREQQTLLGTVDTGALDRPTVAVGMSADGKFTSVTLSQSFRTYGIFIDYSTGSNTPRGNPAISDATLPTPSATPSPATFPAASSQKIFP